MFDVWCDTGDWLPEPPPWSSAEVPRYQMEFVRYEAPALAAKLLGKPFVFCGGNHHWVTDAWLLRELRSHGVNAFCPGHAGQEVLGRRFFGIREIPTIDPRVPPASRFPGECDESDMINQVLSLAGRWQRSDIVLAHCPPRGPTAEENGRQFGNAPLGVALDGAAMQTHRQDRPCLVLTGHIHVPQQRMHMHVDTLVINSATTWRLLCA